MKRLMYLSVSILCLALAAAIGFHLGGRSAAAQTPGMIATAYQVNGTIFHYVLLENGDGYVREIHTSSSGVSFGDSAIFLGNYFDGGTVSTQSGTWGNIKNQYKIDK